MKSITRMRYGKHFVVHLCKGGGGCRGLENASNCSRVVIGACARFGERRGEKKLKNKNRRPVFVPNAICDKSDKIITSTCRPVLDIHITSNGTYSPWVGGWWKLPAKHVKSVYRLRE